MGSEVPGKPDRAILWLAGILLFGTTGAALAFGGVQPQQPFSYDFEENLKETLNDSPEENLI